MRTKYIVIDATLKNGDIQQVIIEAGNYPDGSDPQDYFVRDIAESKQYEITIDDPSSILSPGPFCEEI